MGKLDPSFIYLAMRPGVGRYKRGSEGQPDIVEVFRMPGAFVRTSFAVEDIDRGSREVSADSAEKICQRYVEDMSDKRPAA